MLARATRSAHLRALDLRDRLTGRADPLVPPRRRDFVGNSDFVETGQEFLAHFTELGGLRPDDRVLDIGCGIGRMARPLTGFLSASGSYAGFDVNPEGIEWCRNRYRRFPNFRFDVADLHNSAYHPAGRQAAAEYRFPYADEAFDFVFATSVFTHLLAPETDHYLAETSRVLAPGGRLLATFFLLDVDSRAAIAEGRAVARFPIDRTSSVLREDIPEEAVAFDRDWVAEAFDRHHLDTRDVAPGSWRGTPGRSGQDMLVAERRG